MTEPEKIRYLRNALVIAHADKALASEEDQHLEEIRSNIGATKTQLRKARQDIGSHTIDLAPLTRFSIRVKNLEDMIELALADGTLDANEKRLLAEAAKRVGLSQEQVNLVVAEAKLRRKGAPRKCGTCGADVDASAKFCPQCAADLSGHKGRQRKSLELAIPDLGITIAFAESTASGFADALDLAKRWKSFQEATRGTKRWFAVTLPIERVKSVLAIIAKLRGMRNREVFVDGQKRDWDQVFGFAWCATKRSESYRPIEYCFGLDDARFNIWGCKLLDMDWTTWADWFSFGRFADSRTFEFDRRRITHELQQRTDRVRLCPHLCLPLIAAIVKRLPSRVVVKSGGNWEYREAYQPDPRAITVTIVNDYGRVKQKETIQAVGVQPRDSSLAVKIIKEAAKECGIKHIDYKALANPKTQ